MRIACDTGLRVGATALAMWLGGCLPEVVLKTDPSPGESGASTGGGGGSGGLVACSQPAFEEWSYSAGEKEGLGATIPDLDGDGLGDVAIPFQLSQVLTVRWGSKTPADAAMWKGAVARPNGWVRHGDFDNDGRGDLVVTSMDFDSQSILLQKSPRAFVKSSLTQPTDGRVFVVDVHGDGNQDLLFRTADEYVIYAGNGKGAFGEAKVFAGISRTDELDSGDFDGDGIFELLRIRENAPLTILTFDKDGIGETPIDESGIEDVPLDQRIVMVQDIDGDGRSEALVVTRHSEQGYVEIRTHNHDATPRFDRCWRVPNPSGLLNDPLWEKDPKTTLRFLTAGDVNGDGKLDALFNVGCPFCVYNFSVMVQVP